MRVLGIDPGIANVGFGVIEQWRGEVYDSKRLKVIASGCLLTSPRVSQTRRIYSIARRIKYLIEATEPDVIVVEDFIPFRQRKNMGHISQAYGAIQYVCEDSEATLIIVRPNTWMRSLLGIRQKDRMGKRMIQRFVDKQLKVRTRVEHEAEALGMALDYIRRH
jgi:crossover junction endodeoxyribonuclease RuvC